MERLSEVERMTESTYLGRACRYVDAFPLLAREKYGRCEECDDYPMSCWQGAQGLTHYIYKGVVLIGCEGFWQLIDEV